jgi:hypothetical protein
MRNRAVYQAVAERGAAYQAVAVAVEGAVSRDVNRAVYWALTDAVGRTLTDAVFRAGAWAVYGDPPHVALKLYLMVAAR